jgi:hypothetical protein
MCIISRFVRLRRFIASLSLEYTRALHYLCIIMRVTSLKITRFVLHFARKSWIYLGSSLNDRRFCDANRLSWDIISISDSISEKQRTSMSSICSCRFISITVD